MNNRTNPDLPEGTVTFLFTDIQGSTQLLHRLGDKYITLLADHHRILRETIGRWNGREVDTEGDAFFVSFSRATDAIAAAVEAQQALASHVWPEGQTVRVRMGLHTGEPWTAQEGYVGMDVHRAARIAHVGHGGQVLLSETTTALVRGSLPEEVHLLDLGRHVLKDMQFSEHIRQLVIEGLLSEFPPLKSQGVVEPTADRDRPEARLPRFLKEGESEPERPVFVGREMELIQLEGFLERTLDGKGQVVFLAGDAGSGKSSLMNTFTNRVSGREPTLLVGLGSCNAFSGRGDPYLPFRQALNILTGDVESSWVAGAVTSDQARTIWRAMPGAVENLLDYGPDLLDTFFPSGPLLARLESAFPAGHPVLNRFKTRMADKNPIGQLEQAQLFEQVTSVLRQLAEQQPIMILLDDLQWADSGSLDLLFHLARGLVGARVLIVIAYRPDEIAADEGHPLRRLMSEFRRLFGEAWLDLNRSPGRGFVDELIDSEANLLDDDFRETLVERTGGHPLFTVELLRDMRERGDLIKDSSGNWTIGPSLDWDALPARVEGAIEARIGRLGDELRDILTTAAVEGGTFTAQVLARVLETNDRRLLRTLSRELVRRHQLVHEQSSVKVGRQYLSRYEFSHALFQQYLYQDMADFERRLLHGEVAIALEELYAGQLDDLVVELARHYVEAGEDEKALPYLIRAGDEALRLYAFEDATRHYKRALSILKRQSDYEGASRLLMKLGLTHHSAYQYESAKQAYDEGFALQRHTAISSSPDNLPPALHPLRVKGHQEPVTLDPSKTEEGELITPLFSGLLRYTSELDLLPDLAASWQISDDGQTYIFQIRDDVYWSDGRPVTADDFVYAWQRALDPDGGSPSATVLYDIAGAADRHQGRSDRLGVRATDARTLVVELEQPSSYFLQVLTHGVTMPVPRHVVEVHGDDWSEVDNIVSNGRFLLESWRKGESLMLRRNPTYHGSFPGNVEKVKLLFGIDRSKDLDLFEADELDILSIWSLPPDKLRQAMLQYADNYINGSTNVTGFVGFGVDRPPFDDPRVRRAFVLATDRHHVVENHEMGRAFAATGGFVPPGVPGHVPDIALPTNLAEARRLLAEAGYPDGSAFPPLQALLHPGDTVRIGEFIFKPWEVNLGVDITWDVVDFHEYWDRIREKKPHFFAMGWESIYPDPDGYLRVGMQQISDWHDNVYYDLVEKARRSTDHRERMRLYSQAEAILIEQAPIMPALYLRSSWLLKPWVRNFPLQDEIPYGYYWDVFVLDPH